MALEDIKTEAVRSRGFIRGADTQLSKVIAGLDAEIEATVEAPGSVVTDPPENPEPPTSPAPPSMLANMPAGGRVLYDDNFESGTIGKLTDWGYGAALGPIDDPTGVDGRVWQTEYPAGLSGTGPMKISYELGGLDRVYCSWRVKWDADFDHNRNEEKWLYFNVMQGGPGVVLFCRHYDVEAVAYLEEPGYNGGAGYPTSKDRLRANMAAVPKNHSGDPLAQPTPGEWNEYELLYDRTAKTVKWWKDGELRAEHVGVEGMPALHLCDLTATWGGGGDKQGVQSRYTDRLVIVEF